MAGKGTHAGTAGWHCLDLRGRGSHGGSVVGGGAVPAPCRGAGTDTHLKGPGLRPHEIRGTLDQRRPLARRLVAWSLTRVGAGVVLGHRQGYL